MRTAPLLWTIFIFYIFLLAFTGIHHELWGDEVHSFNIAKASTSYTELLLHRRYEGHPPAWYTLLWALSAFTHQVGYMQLLQGFIAAAVAWLILFKARFSLTTRILIPFGYYFLYEYGVFSRNYALGVLFACCICIVLQKEFKYKQVLYYLLLFCLSNVHLLTLLLAFSLHVYFLMAIREKKNIFFHTLIGIGVLLPAAWFIHLPSDGEVDLHAWVHHWNISRLGDLYAPLLRGLLPIPAWWNYHFWNTEFLLEAANNHSLFRILNPIVGVMLFLCGLFILRGSKKCFAFFTINTFLNCLLSVTVFSLNTARHTGFIYIGLIVAWWLYGNERKNVNSPLLNILLVVQLLAGAIAVVQDIRYPFSNTDKVTELIREVPAGSQLVTDYWTMNAVVAFTDKPVYCVDIQDTLSFVLFDSRLGQVDRNPHRYTDGIRALFKKGASEIYMISLSSPALLARVDTLLDSAGRLTLMDKREGAIEQGSNLYLYKISSK